jgi:hypothetical protein
LVTDGEGRFDKKKARRRGSVPFLNPRNEGLDHGHVSGGWAFGTLFDFKGDPIAFAERPETAGIDRRMMNEYIRTVFLFDKTKPLAVIEPLHDTICHADFLLQLNKNIIASNLRRHI